MLEHHDPWKLALPGGGPAARAAFGAACAAPGNLRLLEASFDPMLTGGYIRRLIAHPINGKRFRLGTSLYAEFDGRYHGEWHGEQHLDGDTLPTAR